MGERTQALAGAKRRGRRRIGIWAAAAATVFALAAVILVVSSVSAPRRSTVPADGAASLADVSRADVSAARIAIESGDNDRAREALRAALVADPSNEEARRLLASLVVTVAPTVDSGDSGEERPPSAAATSGGDAAFTRALPDVAVLLPRSVPGLVAGRRTGGGAEAVQPLDPVRGGRYDGVASRVLLSVHDRGSTVSAARFVSTVSRRVYGRDAAAVTVRGTAAYFGTDGRALATLAFARGRYAFEVVIASTGGRPSVLRPAAIAIGAAFPTRMP